MKALSPLTDGLRTQVMQAEELDAVLAIEREAFPEEPWTRGMFLRELQVPFATSLVVRSVSPDYAIVGYICWRTLGDELEILNLAVARPWQRKRIGHALVAMAIDAARRQEANKIHLEVREDNVPAISLYSDCEFSPSGLRRHYYGRGQHALLMTWNAAGGNLEGTHVDNKNLSD